MAGEGFPGLFQQLGLLGIKLQARALLPDRLHTGEQRLVEED